MRVEVGDKVYNCIFPEEYSVGTVVSRESQNVYLWLNG